MIRYEIIVRDDDLDCNKQCLKCVHLEVPVTFNYASSDVVFELEQCDIANEPHNLKRKKCPGFQD